MSLIEDADVVGFIGLGPMGHGMAKNLLQKGVTLWVKGNRNNAPVENLVGLGAMEARSLGEIADQVDVIFLCLPSSTEVEATVLGDGGLLYHMRKGQLLIDCSTSNPDSTRRIAKLLQEREIDFIDAPLTRSSKEAEAGTLNVIVGGDQSAIGRAQPLIDRFAENVFLSGGVGSAHQLKLVNNFLSIGCALVVSEAIATAQRTGVDTKLLHSLASQGGANSGALQQIMPWVNEGLMNFRFAIRNAHKDIDYFGSMTNAALPIWEAVANALTSLVEQGHGELFMPQIVDLLGGRPTPQLD